MAEYFEQSFGSVDVDESEGWLNAQYGQVRVQQRLTSYEERVVGDERFFLTAVDTAGSYRCRIDPDVVLVVDASPGFRWEQGFDSGSPAHRPALFQPDRPYTAVVSDSQILGVGLYVTSLQRTARLLYAQDDLDVRFDGPHPSSAAAAGRWLAALELLRLEERAGLLTNDIIRAEAYRMVSIAALESFRLVADRRSLRTSVERQAKVYRAAAGFLREYASLPITVEDAAEAAGASTAELVDAFRAQAGAGLTPARFLLRARIDGACAELAEAPDTADPDAIAAGWGFPSEAALGRAHRREYAAPPPRRRPRRGGTGSAAAPGR